MQVRFELSDTERGKEISLRGMDRKFANEPLPIYIDFSGVMFDGNEKAPIRGGAKSFAMLFDKSTPLGGGWELKDWGMESAIAQLHGQLLYTFF